MFLYTISVVLFTLLCIFLVLIILVQKGKSSMGLGSLGGGTQMLFGGSGGQDLFQKVTWAMGALFMFSSLALAIIKRPTSSQLLGSLARTQAAAQLPAPAVPTMPTAAQTATAQPVEQKAEPVTAAPTTAQPATEAQK
jgi:preprotein translocase subunit SecG